MLRPSMQIPRCWAVASAVVAVTLLLSSACSLRYDFTECSSTADCARIENPAAGERYQCVANQCVAVSGAPTDDVGNTPGTDTDRPDTQDTTQPPSDTSSPDSVEPPDVQQPADATSDTADTADTNPTPDANSTACTTTQQCITQFGDSFYCTPRGTCADTSSPVCDPIYYPSRARGKVMLLGSIIPTQGAAYENLGATIRNAVRMAVIQYTDNALTLLNGATVAHLHCEGGSTEIARQSAEHLHALGAPVVVGPLTSTAFIDVVQNVGAANPDANGVVEDPMVAIAMGASATAISSLDSLGKYAFQIIPNDFMQAPAMVDRTKILRHHSCLDAGAAQQCEDDEQCQATFGPDFTFDAASAQAPCKKGTAKIVVFYKDDQYGNGFHTLLITHYYNRYPDAQLKYYKYPDPADLDFMPDRIQAAFAPIVGSSLSGPEALPDADLVIFIGTGEATSLAKMYILGLQQVNAQLPMTRRYIFSHGAAADAPTMFSGAQALPSALVPKFEAVAPNVFNEPYYSAWQNQYNLQFQEVAKTSVGGLAYDAAYMGIFAMAAVPVGQPINGTTVAAVIETGRLQDPDAEVIKIAEVTSDGAARAAFRDGKNINMIGVSGSLDFVFDGDRNKGTVRSNYLGLDVDDLNLDGVYEIVPRRVYVLSPGENTGVWMPIPAP